LRTKAPDSFALAQSAHSFSHTVDHTGTVAVRDYARVGHPHLESILPLLDVSGVYPRGGNADAHFSFPRLRRCHFSHDQHFGCGSLSFVPSSLHRPSFYLNRGSCRGVGEHYNGDHRDKLWGPEGRIKIEILPWFGRMLDFE
jgi:hypothetical protein